MADKIANARIHNRAQLYDQAYKFMLDVVKKGEVLEIKDQYLLSDIIKNKVGSRRKAWRVVRTLQELSDQLKPHHKKKLDDYALRIRKELDEVCMEMIKEVHSKLFKTAVTDESKVFYLKIKCDCYRYICECNPGGRGDMISAAQGVNGTAQQLFCTMPKTSAARLAFILNYSVFLHDITKDKYSAIALLKETFDEAMPSFAPGSKYLKEECNKPDNERAVCYLQLMKDNLRNWTGGVSDETPSIEELFMAAEASHGVESIPPPKRGMPPLESLNPGGSPRNAPPAVSEPPDEDDWGYCFFM